MHWLSPVLLAIALIGAGCSTTESSKADAAANGNTIDTGPPGDGGGGTDAVTGSANEGGGASDGGKGVDGAGTNDTSTVTLDGSASTDDGNGGNAVPVPNDWAQWPMPNSAVDIEAGAPNPESYTDHGDGTVTDNLTGLIWQQAVPPASFQLAAATSYCANLTLAGHHDWRLPTYIELVSIVDYTQSPSINAIAFPNTPSSHFASSTLWVNTAQGERSIDFRSGATSKDDPRVSVSVRCAR